MSKEPTHFDWNVLFAWALGLAWIASFALTLVLFGIILQGVFNLGWHVIFWCGPIAFLSAIVFGGLTWIVFGARDKQ